MRKQFVVEWGFALYRGGHAKASYGTTEVYPCQVIESCSSGMLPLWTDCSPQVLGVQMYFVGSYCWP